MYNFMFTDQKNFCHSSKKLEFSFINDVLRVVDALYLSNGKSLISSRTIRKTLVYARLDFDDYKRLSPKLPVT